MSTWSQSLCKFCSFCRRSTSAAGHRGSRKSSTLSAASATTTFATRTLSSEATSESPARNEERCRVPFAQSVEFSALYSSITTFLLPLFKELPFPTRFVHTFYKMTQRVVTGFRFRQVCCTKVRNFKIVRAIIKVISRLTGWILLIGLKYKISDKVGRKM